MGYFKNLENVTKVDQQEVASFLKEINFNSSALDLLLKTESFLNSKYVYNESDFNNIIVEQIHEYKKSKNLRTMYVAGCDTSCTVQSIVAYPNDGGEFYRTGRSIYYAGCMWGCENHQ